MDSALPAVLPTPTPAEGPPSSTSLRRFVKQTLAKVEQTTIPEERIRRAETAEHPIRAIEIARDKLEAIDYRVEDHSESTEAFGLFHRTVATVHHTEDKEDDEVLEALEP